MIDFLSINKTKILINSVFIIIIISIVYFFIGYSFGDYLMIGDLSLHINKEMFGDRVNKLISFKYSNNNFVFLSLHSIYFILEKLSYHAVLIYILFGIPILLYLSMTFVLSRIINVNKDNNLSNYLLTSALAFYFAVNPALFIRYGHWPILQGFIFLPLYVYTLFRYLRDEKKINMYLWVIPPLLFFGISAPQFIILYPVIGILTYIAVLIINKVNFLEYIKKGFLVLLLGTISVAHILYPVFLGYGKIKSVVETRTNEVVLHNLSENSSLLTAMSGTNFFEESIKYSFPLNVGYFIFLFCLYLFYKYSKNKNKINLLLFASILFFLIIISGYDSFKYFFKILINSPLIDILWVIKDPNMYYLLFLIFMLFLFYRLIILNVKKMYIFIVSFFIIFLNIVFLFTVDKTTYNNNFYKFVKIPKEYFGLVKNLEDDSHRNLWLPNKTYINKNFSKDIIYFPSPYLWLAKNKSMTVATPEYGNLIKTIEKEIYDENCEHSHFLNWIISAQNLNVIIDNNSEDNIVLKEYDIKPKLAMAEKCLLRLPNIYKYKSFGNIDVYRSNLEFKDGLYKFSGNIGELNGFLENNPVNVVYEKYGSGNAEEIKIKDYTILNESYDENWRNSSEKSPKMKVNMVSMLFEGSGKDYHYRGNNGFEFVKFLQKILLVISLILWLIYSWIKKGNLWKKKQ